MNVRLPGLSPPGGDGAWGKAAERSYQGTVQDALDTFGWRWMHVYPLKDSSGRWRTPTSGTLAKGWVDHTAFRGDYILGIEIKGYDSRGRPTAFQPGQKACLEVFAAIPTGRAWVLRPTDPISDLVSWLRFPQDAPRRFGYDPDLST